MGIFVLCISNLCSVIDTLRNAILSVAVFMCVHIAHVFTLCSYLIFKAGMM